MKNPVNKRIPRIFLTQPGRYFPIFFLLFLTTVMMSSFFIVQGSIKKLYERDLREKKVESGQFTAAQELSSDTIASLEKENIRLYQNFYVEEAFSPNKVLRIYQNRTSINLPSLFQGRLPKKADEIAIAQNMAATNHQRIGDTIKLAGNSFKIVGFFSVPDYSSLLKNRSDLVMDTGYFGIALVSASGFRTFDPASLKYCYSYHTQEKLSASQAHEKLNTLTKIVHQSTAVTDGVTRFDNKCITYVMDDMGGDVPMMITLMTLILISISFVVTMQARTLIEDEAPVIGTLLASGYTKKELLFHYLCIPLSLTILASALGNLLAYTKVYHLFSALYYNSFSLPPFTPVFSLRAFILTTVIPVSIMFFVNLLMLSLKLNLTPLRFLRKEFVKQKNRKTLSLEKLGFVHRFRIRVLLDNKLNILTLFLGLFLANVMLIFGLSFKPIFHKYTDDIQKEMKYNYITLIKSPQPVQEDAKKTVVAKLDLDSLGKEISFYGMESGSKYESSAHIRRLAPGEVAVSRGFSRKYQLKTGSRIQVKIPYTSRSEKLKIAVIMEDIHAVEVYLPLKHLNRLLGKDLSYYNAYFSDTKLSLNKDLLITEIDRAGLSKYMDHFLDSFQSVSTTLLVVSLCFYLILLYVLSKLILDKSRTDISYLKIFGFQTGEISRIYIASVRNAVILYLLLLMPLLDIFTKKLIQISFRKLDAYIEASIPFYMYLIAFVLGIAIYVLVQFLQAGKISRLNMAESLKEVSG